MKSSRRSLFLWIVVLSGGMVVLTRNAADDHWMKHPALAEPDGSSHRGHKMVAAEIDDLRVLAELSRRFRQTRPLSFDRQGQIRGAEDFENRQEYLLRLLDFYWFSEQRLMGMSRAAVAGVFGPFSVAEGRAIISGGRDALVLDFKNDLVSGAQYVMGY